MSGTTRQILNKVVTHFSGEVLVSISDQGKKLTASIGNGMGAPALDIADESGKVKQFANVEAVVKHIGKFCSKDATLVVDVMAGDYAPSVVAGDPVAALEKEKTNLTKEIAKTALVIAKENANIVAAVALGWETGTTEQIIQLEEQRLRVALVTELKTAMEVRLAALNAL